MIYCNKAIHYLLLIFVVFIVNYPLTNGYTSRYTSTSIRYSTYPDTIKLNHKYLLNQKAFQKCIFVNKISKDIDNDQVKLLDSNENIIQLQNNSLSNPLIAQSFFLLNGVAVIWGSQHVIIKTMIETFPQTSLVNFWRFLISTLVFSPTIINLMKTETKRDLWFSGFELGLYIFLGFSFQAIGLETTLASRSAFLLYLNVKFVPILAFLIYQKKFPLTTWISAALALLGTFLLSTDAYHEPTIGDLWSIFAAIASAMYILRLESFSSKYNPSQLNAISFMTVSFLCTCWLFTDINSHNLNLSYDDIVQPLQDNFLALLFLGGIATALCNYLQSLGQRYISADKAAIIYSADPIYGGIFSFLFLGERFTSQGYIGAAFIMLGIWVTSMNSKEVSKE